MTLSIIIKTHTHTHMTHALRSVDLCGGFNLILLKLLCVCKESDSPLPSRIIRTRGIIIISIHNIIRADVEIRYVHHHHRHDDSCV